MFACIDIFNGQGEENTVQASDACSESLNIAFCFPPRAATHEARADPKQQTDGMNNDADRGAGKTCAAPRRPESGHEARRGTGKVYVPRVAAGRGAAWRR